MPPVRRFPLNAALRFRAVILALVLCAACGCAYGPPAATPIDRTAIAIPAGAAPVHAFHVPRITVYYYWNKVNRYDIEITAKAWFPAEWKDDGDARWEVAFATLPTPDLDTVPGAFMGIQRQYVDGTGAKMFEVVPAIALDTLKDGLYGVVENGVETDPADPKKIKAIRPILHVKVIRDGKLDLRFDMPVQLLPVTVSDLTPMPVHTDDGSKPRGTTIGSAEPPPVTKPGESPAPQIDPLTGMPAQP